MAKLGSFLFIENVDAYIDMLNKWLGGTVVQDRKNDNGETGFVLYKYDEIMFGIVKPREESTNTPSKVNGSTNSLVLFVNSKEEVEDLYKKGVVAGLSSESEPGYLHPEDTSTPYYASFKDNNQQYWAIVYRMHNS